MNASPINSTYEALYVTSRIIAFKLTSKLTTVLLASLFLTACGSEDSGTSILSGQWRSEQIPFNGQLETDTLKFNSDGSFIISKDLRHVDGQTSTLYSNGEYSIGEKYQSDSGLMITQLDLVYYGKNTNELTQKEPNTNYSNYLDAFYINDDTLYLGTINEIEACEGEFYSTESDDIVIVNGQVVSFENSSTCYARPTSINFNNPHFKLTNAE